MGTINIMLNDMLIGGVAGIVSRTATAPLELYKIQLQSGYLKNSTMTNVINKEGLRHMWKGNGANCLRVFPQFAINYSVYSKCKNDIFNKVENNETKNFISGGVAGMVAMVVIYPLETIRTRLSLQMNRSHYSNIVNVFQKLTLSQLYSGLKISILGFTPFSAFNFMFYNTYLDHFQKYKIDDTISKMMAGGLSGITSLSITYPTDLLRRRFQMDGFNEQTPKYNGIIDGFKKVIKNEGILGLYRGLPVAYIRVFPCLAIQFWCIEKGKNVLNQY